MKITRMALCGLLVGAGFHPALAAENNKKGNETEASLSKEKTNSALPDSFTTEFGVEKEDLSATGRNPFFLLEPGCQWILEDGEEQLQITILNETKVVDGVETRVLEERETRNGLPVEVSRNYLAISRRNNSVFYFGEDVDDYKDGKIVDNEGAWQSGKKGATFGLTMPGQILLKAKYYQEIAPGVTMDRAEIVSMNETVTTPAGTFQNCLKVEETSPLEPGEKEYKYFAPGIGLVQDESLKLVRWSGPKEASTPTLSLSDLPEAARAAIEKLTAGGNIRFLEKEEVEGELIFDVEATVNDVDVEYDIAADGTVLSAEESVPYDSLPEAVRVAAEEYFGSGEGRLDASKEVEKGQTFFEVKGKKGAATREIKITGDGQITEEE